MTLIEAINEADRLRPNAFSAEDKIRWLERLDRRIAREILQTHRGTAVSAPDYGSADAGRTLLAEAPYDEMYVRWLCAQMDFFNGETDSFNADNALFEALFSGYRNRVNREHLPLTAEKRYG